jgi:hypothetical protein
VVETNFADLGKWFHTLQAVDLRKYQGVSWKYGIDIAWGALLVDAGDPSEGNLQNPI